MTCAQGRCAAQILLLRWSLQGIVTVFSARVAEFQRCSLFKNCGFILACRRSHIFAFRLCVFFWLLRGSLWLKNHALDIVVDLECQRCSSIRKCCFASSCEWDVSKVDARRSSVVKLVSSALGSFVLCASTVANQPRSLIT